jgi:SAM-dependent methyltransferase
MLPKTSQKNFVAFVLNIPSTHEIINTDQEAAMLETHHGARFQDLAGNPRVSGFARQILIPSYVECVPGYETAMLDLLEKSFSALAQAANNDDRFLEVVNFLIGEVFRKSDPDFWFNRLYHRYKSQFKPHSRFSKLQPWLQGRRVLDLGCGDGLTGLILQQNGCQVSMTDVLDYRDEAACSMPFQAMVDPEVIPFPADSFDTAIVFTVLHHVDEEHLVPLLDELRRTSRRVIIEEDSYDIPEDLVDPSDEGEEAAQLRAFMALPVEDQVGYLMFVDYFANAITQGLPQMHMPFHFKTPREWQALFSERGFHVERTLVKGFQKDYFNRSCHLWYILDRE